MKVLTLNAHSWLEENQLEKLNDLARNIIKEKYDIIALQEVNQTDKNKIITPNEYFYKTKDHDDIKEDNFAYLLTKILEKNNLYYHWSWTFNHFSYEKYNEGVAILSLNKIKPKSLLLSEKFDLTDYRTRVAMVIETKVNNRDILALSGHYSWWNGEEGFKYEWSQTEKLLNKNKLPFILMGDFNNPAHIEDEGYNKIISNKLSIKDSFLHSKKQIGEFTVEKNIAGWEDNKENLRIDYIFTSKEFNIDEYRVVFDGKNGSIISDHYGIAVKLNI